MAKAAVLIIALAVILFSIIACGKKSYDYSKILKGDLSDFAGNWKNGSYASFRLKADGTYGDFERTSDVIMESGGYYTWSLSSKTGNYVTSLALFPAGVDIIADGKIIQTDKTKVRIRSGNYGSSNEEIFYLKASDTEIAAAEALAFQAALSEGYAKLLKRDFSDVAGYYVNGNSRIQLRADGTTNDEVQASAARRNDDGTYSWGMWADGSGWAAVLFPVGVEVHQGAFGQTDTKKIRLWMGQDFTSTDDIYYPEPSGTAKFYATSNLRLRSEPDTSKNNRITAIPEGGIVALLEVGKTENIDGITAPWYKVKTADGTIGWVFSGYLTALLEFYYNLGTSRLHWYQTSKTEWTEEDPDGNKNYFIFEKESVLDGVKGTVVKRSNAYIDTGFRLFIPNKAEKNRAIRSYDPDFYKTSDWQDLGNITYLN